MDVVARRAHVRKANASIAAVARQAEFVAPTPFICECGDDSCTGQVRLAVDAFEIVVSQADWYLMGNRHGFRAAVLSADGVVVELPALPQRETLLDGVAGIVPAGRRHEQPTASLRQATIDLEDSRRRIAEAADKERARIQRDLHDGAQQRLLAISIKLAHAEQDLQTDPAAASAELGRVSLELDAALRELQSLAAGVYPPVLAAYGVTAALKDLSLRTPLPVHISDSGLTRHQMEVESAVYFTIAEAMQNATKHAHDATGIWIHLSEAANALHFQISDDGAGMKSDATPGHGLQNMRDRIEAVGGHLTIESPPGGGTQVTASVPAPA
jgi:signal transduction histidine kinase